MAACRAWAVAAIAVAVLLTSASADEPRPMRPPVPAPLLTRDPAQRDEELLRFLATPRRAEKPAPVSRGPKSATVIPLEVLDPHLVAATLVKSRCLPIGATVEPLADEKALLVYADATTIKEIKDVLRMLGESVPAPKRPQTIPVPASFDVNEVTKAVKKLFPAKTVIVPLADEHSLLAYVTDEDAEVIRQAIRPFVEQQPAKTPSHSPMTAPQRPGPVRPVSP